jgi:cysteine desulfurase / selenocysteine lyase
MDLNAYRAEFAIAEQHAFLNHASVSSYSNRVVDALRDHAERMQQVPFDRLRDSYLMPLMAGFKQRVVQLIGARSPDEIVPMPNTAAGINTAAQSLPLQAGDNVLVVDGDYPANIYPWLNLAPKGVLVKWVPQHAGGAELNRLAARIDRRTRVIAVSSVMFATGYKNDLAAIGELCRQRGIFFVVDGIQSLGAFPLDVQALGIDMLACGSQKWLMGAPGSGFLYVRAELMDQLQPGAYVGTTSTVDPFNFLDYNFTLRPTADRFDLGTPNVPGLAALHAALGLLLEVGSTLIAEHILALTDTLIEDLHERGYKVLSNLEQQHRSGIVIVEVDDPQAAYERLLAANVLTSVRGQGLRVSPHFYNSEEDVLRVGEVLGSRS